MYSVEWQKRGLPHAHILIWSIDKIRPEEIDSIICKEIPDPSTDQLPTVQHSYSNHDSLHMRLSESFIVLHNISKGICAMHCPKYFTNGTITSIYDYPMIYHRINTDNDGQSFPIHTNNTDIGVDDS